MYEIVTDANDGAEYECLNCGHIVVAESHPGDCPECDGGMVGRSVSLE